jgi:hypothetical protein
MAVGRATGRWAGPPDTTTITITIITVTTIIIITVDITDIATCKTHSTLRYTAHHPGHTETTQDSRRAGAAHDSLGVSQKQTAERSQQGI